MQTVGLQIRCGMQGVNQSIGFLRPPRGVTEEGNSWRGRSGLRIRKNVPDPAWGGLSISHKLRCPVGKWVFTMRTGREIIQALQRAPYTAFVVAGHLQAVGTPLTVHGLWFSSGWVRTYSESLFVLHEASREVAQGCLRSLLCFFWRNLATSAERTFLPGHCTHMALSALCHSDQPVLGLDVFSS